MENIITNYTGETFEVELYFTNKLKGRGSWNIECEATFNNEKKVFKIHTTESLFIDRINDLKADNTSFDEIQKEYFDFSFDILEENLIEWCVELNEINN